MKTLKQSGITLIFFLLIFLTSCDQKENNTPGNKPKTTETPPSKHNEQTEIETDSDDSLLSITGVGDIMMGTNYPTSASLPPNDGEGIFDEVSEYLQDSKVTFGNLEGVLLNSGGKPKKCDSSKNCISFRMPEHYAAYLKDAGFESLA